MISPCAGNTSSDFFPPAPSTFRTATTGSLPSVVWLAPERRAETYLAMLQAGLWIASFATLAVLGIHLLVVDANAAQPVRLSNYVWLLLAGMLTGVGCILFWLIRRFKAPTRS